ncbi:hypothetical protein GOC91_21435 [Sinorhizobium medicae]|uniref:Outer membrane protein beta-barrel domain-containing protein n=2 Tax=Sinorhizobium medicae TaxID=110321 RepID=A0A508WZW2_9HYPH|nr:hypothetical protein [Sinorhizobium medicae]ABR62597.1 conserved hypothetical protein [Sinorhizobium medicae WSM419]MBO1942289.1 hypothetical protein [Sinorhizobium medicae]MBO1961309.1 hypothetical protein [Sinorhizobium medicae]MDX0406851.1 hypothetical protein [Sinorhizobium medicae]MDX0412399.1 hypothetical protein [Sinorhizobium medicae]
MTSGFIRTLALAGTCLLAGGATAADIYSPVAPETQQVTTESGWTFSFSPYFWAAGLSGDIEQFGLPAVDVDASFSDVFDHLDFALMATAEARNGPYSIFGDAIYIKLSGEGGTPRGIIADDVKLSTETFTGTLGAGYAIYEDSAARLDIVGGLRVWSVESELSFSGGILPPGGVSRSDDATWVDGIAGFRGTYSFTPEVYLTGWGLVGAGGADLDWDVAAAIGYRFSDTISALAGYRALGVDYSNDGFVFDVVEQGPILGLVVRF